MIRAMGSEMQDARCGMSYRDLEIWKLARQVVIAVHRMTLQNLPKFEMFEEASQIRRSAKSISANVVEGRSNRTDRRDIPDPESRISHHVSPIAHLAS